MLPKIVIICFFISINIAVFILEGWLLKKKKIRSKLKNIVVISHI